MNWTVIIIFGILATALIVFLIYRNQKDEKQFENKLNNDFPKPKGEEGNPVLEDMANNE